MATTRLPAGDVRLPWMVGTALLAVSGVTHVVQLAFYSGVAFGAAAFGVLYFALAVAQFARPLAAGLTWVCVVAPTIGGVLGVLRFVHAQPNPFSVVHVIMDLILVPCFAFCLVRVVRNAPERTDAPINPAG
ncbi:hypothetical protein JVX90_11740 [Gordonia sp. PDNC005]|uniref:hypothetical protein n=1 Tax=unclassified Gordonia (in: high G+C Gram-positive bacteria) TaxID=2657482 RepID=UPI00196461C9|nr:hypothetical protein [Gordonia sp. PDNC005]QRY61115.1 hypothetical protein JVX90_11740 [Gordonia sp. PDNC005]